MSHTEEITANELGQQRPEGTAERLPVEKVVKVARSLRSGTSQFKLKGGNLAGMLCTLTTLC